MENDPNTDSCLAKYHRHISVRRDHQSPSPSLPDGETDNESPLNPPPAQFEPISAPGTTEPQPHPHRASSGSGSARRDTYRSSRRNSKAALESLLNLKVNTPAEKFQQRMSLRVGWDFRFARDSEFSKEDMLALQRGRTVRFLVPGPEAMHTYEQVQLEGQVTPDMDAQSDVHLIAAVDGNIEDIKAISLRLEIAIKVEEI